MHLEGLADFETLYRTHYRQVRATVLGFRLSSGAVDDAIQDTFVSAWQNLANLKDPKAFSGWLLTIARNRCLQELRRQKPTLSVAGTDDLGDEPGAEVVLVAEDSAASFHWEHSVQLMRELIETHDSEPRATVARLFYLDKQPVKDIAARLSLKQNTVLSHLHRFRMVVSEAAVRLFEERGIEVT
jgi:RNA polymerase sigma-70 factor (ECF subfamily)